MVGEGGCGKNLNQGRKDGFYSAIYGAMRFSKKHYRFSRRPPHNSPAAAEIEGPLAEKFLIIKGRIDGDCQCRNLIFKLRDGVDT